MRPIYIFILLCVGLFSCVSPNKKDSQAEIQAALTKWQVEGRWTPDRINQWYDSLPWLVGCNYYPATAINQIDMWQGSTWDPETIDRELGWAEEIGMNTLRVYLHDVVWGADEAGLYRRMDQFLDICQSHGIRPWFVFFDDCHYPEPKLGQQPKPVPRIHNSGWVNSPARELAARYADGKATPEEEAYLKGYVQRTMEHFGQDARILMWELYNEPGRGNTSNAQPSPYKSMGDRSSKLVYDSWVWAREANPSQPITSTTAGANGKQNILINRVNSDLHSIHSYKGPRDMFERIQEYKKDGRPVIMSEWLARTAGSTVESCLPMMKALNVGAVNWGFVSGESGTIWPWRSRRDSSGTPINLDAQRAEGNVVPEGGPYPEPELWFHDLFRTDGTPFDPLEIEVFKALTKE
ncbi:MAG: cellulase family glycosylhydrolase [Bacteroidota bacterium]